jgi:outer membrane protein OmpA-like peptidoglycan-associated protein
VTVDASGCPADADKDGVPDYRDKCPGTPAKSTVDASGCPTDADEAGVPDYKDICPNTPANLSVHATGCPIDTDQDGVPDYLDKCPNTPISVKIDAVGCPIDTDKDGIPDYIDKCPNVAGLAGNKGCPEIKKETEKIFTQALQGVQFESGKDLLKKTSFSILDKVVTVLKDNPSYNLEINGYTDSQGDEAINLGLSQKRADAVGNYLVKKGIDETRLLTLGYGETMPVADNATAAGRAKNRRVEFKVNF